MLLVVQGGGADGIEVDEGEEAMVGMIFWQRKVQRAIL